MFPSDSGSVRQGASCRGKGEFLGGGPGLQHLPRAAGSDLFPPQNSLTSFKKSKIFPREFGSAGRGARSRGKGKFLGGGPVSAAPSAGSRQRFVEARVNGGSSAGKSLTSFKKSKIFPREFGSAGRGARSRGKGKLLGGGPVSAAPSAGSRQRILARRRTH